MEEKTPMEQLIEKIELYDQRGGINMITLTNDTQIYLGFLFNIYTKIKYEDER